MLEAYIRANDLRCTRFLAWTWYYADPAAQAAHNGKLGSRWPTQTSYCCTDHDLSSSYVWIYFFHHLECGCEIEGRRRAREKRGRLALEVEEVDHDEARGSSRQRSGLQLCPNHPHLLGVISTLMRLDGGYTREKHDCWLYVYPDRYTVCTIISYTSCNSCTTSCNSCTT